MRKNLILSAVAFAALAFAGCSQNDVLNESPSVNKAIEFGTYVGRDAESRASVVTETTLQTDGFGVFAYYTYKDDFDATKHTTPNFMNNEHVTYSTGDSKWVYDPVKYWPNNPGDKVSFFAYVPYGKATLNTSTPGAVDFAVAQDVASQIDLLWNRTSQLNKEKKDQTIGFTVQGSVDQVGLTPDPDPGKGGTLATGTTITIEKVMLSGGTHTYNGKDNVTLSNIGAFYPKGTLNLNNFGATGVSAAWTPDNTSTKLVFTLGSSNFDNSSISGSQATSTKLTNDNSYLMVIPQEFTNNSLYVYIQYKVTTTDAALDGGKSEITNYIRHPLISISNPERPIRSI